MQWTIAKWVGNPERQVAKSTLLAGLSVFNRKVQWLSPTSGLMAIARLLRWKGPGHEIHSGYPIGGFDYSMFCFLQNFLSKAISVQYNFAPGGLPPRAVVCVLCDRSTLLHVRTPWHMTNRSETEEIVFYDNKDRHSKLCDKCWASACSVEVRQVRHEFLLSWL